MSSLKTKPLIVYQGTRGSFSEQASMCWAELEKINGEFYPVKTAVEAFNQVKSGRATYGVLGVKNSSSGDIGETVDLIGINNKCSVVGSITLPVLIGLYGLPNGERNENHITHKNGGITSIVSHPASLYQCENTLKSQFPNVELIASPTSAVAASRLSSGVFRPGTAVLCSEHAAKLYGLYSILFPVNDSQKNETTFMIFKAK